MELESSINHNCSTLLNINNIQVIVLLITTDLKNEDRYTSTAFIVHQHLAFVWILKVEGP